MGGTVASGTGAPMPVLDTAYLPAPPPPSSTPLVGGVAPISARLEGPAMSTAYPTVTDGLPLNYTNVQQPIPVAPTPAPAGDVNAIIAQLQSVLGTLSALLQTLQGAAGVQGGGGQVPGSCACCGHSPMQGSPMQGDPGQGDPGQATTTPPAPPGSPPNGSAAPSSSLPPNGDVRQRIVQAARDELARGVREDAGEDKDHAGRIREYRTAVTSAGENPDAAEPWCADFASWVWKRAGVPFGPGGEGEDYTVAMVKKAKSMGAWHDRGSYEPKPGDLVLFDWGRGSDVDHVAVVEKVENGKVYTIGGNESDRVKADSYDLGDTRMMGFVNPTGT